MGTIYFWPILALCFVRSVVPFGYLLGLCLKFVWAFLELIFQFYWIMNLLLQGGWSLQSRFSAASKNANTFFRAPLPSELVTALGCSLSNPSDPSDPLALAPLPAVCEVMVCMLACAMQITGGSPRVSAEPVPVSVACHGSQVGNLRMTWETKFPPGFRVYLAIWRNVLWIGLWMGWFMEMHFDFDLACFRFSQVKCKQVQLTWLGIFWQTDWAQESNAIPVLVPCAIACASGGNGWNLEQYMQKATVWQIPLAIGVASSFSAFTEIPMSKKCLFYWWEPDTLFATLEPKYVTFPAYDAAAWAAGNYSTAPANVMLENLVSYDLPDLAPDVYGFIHNFQMSMDTMRGIMLDVASGTSAYEAACQWTKQNEDVPVLVAYEAAHRQEPQESWTKIKPRCVFEPPFRLKGPTLCGCSWRKMRLWLHPGNLHLVYHHPVR